MSDNEENFAAAIRLLMTSTRLTQGDFAKNMEIPKTTISKWLVDQTRPKLSTVSAVSEELNKYFAQNKKIIQIDETDLLGDPYQLAKKLGIEMYKAHSIINRTSVSMRNLVFSPRDLMLGRITGVYQIFYPSLLYNKLFFTAAMKIIDDKDDGLFYFEIFSQKSEHENHALQQLYQFGSIGRAGSGDNANAVFIGDVMAENDENKASVRFISFKLFEDCRPDYLSGTTIGLNFNDSNVGFGYLMPAPIVAKPLVGARKSIDISEYIPNKTYLSTAEMQKNHSEVLGWLSEVPQPWCYKLSLD